MSKEEQIINKDEELDVINFQSDDRSETDKVEPMPAWVKTVLIGSLVLLVAGGIILYQSMMGIVTNEVDVEDVYLVESDKSLSDEFMIERVNTKGTGEKKKPLTESSLTIGPVQDGDEIAVRMSSMELQIQELNQQVQLLTEQKIILQQMNQQMGQMAEHIDTLPTENDLTEIREEFKQMLERVKSEFQSRLMKKYTAAKSYISQARSKRAKSIPFKLVSIDLWDGHYYAAIQSKSIGAIENLRLGDTRSGWKVERIDQDESSVVFKDTKSGVSVKQTAI